MTLPKFPSLGTTTRRLRSIGALVLGAMLLSYAFGGLWSAYVRTHNPHPLPRSASTAGTSTDETKIDPHSVYSVPPDQPKSIELPTIKTSGYIQPVGVTPANAMAVPSNINLAGWYNASAKPGDKGLSIINGHVTGNYAPGIFRHLSDLKNQDNFTVKYGDNSVRTFKVTSVHEYSLNDINTAMFTKLPDIGRQLNLITCGGTYDAQAHAYTSRILVVAEAL